MNILVSTALVGLGVAHASRVEDDPSDEEVVPLEWRSDGGVDKIAIEGDFSRVDVIGDLGAEARRPGVQYAFGGYDTETDWSEYPARASVALSSKFPLEDLGCSAAFVDAYHVLTAAHCVEDDALGGLAESIHVSGYDQRWAQAVSATYFSVWSDHESWSHDIAVVRLNSPLGALYGSYGMGPTSCLHALTASYQSYSFPADVSGVMYTSGGFDSCSGTHQMHSSSAAWSSMSGGAIWDVHGNELPRAEAVWSHATTLFYGVDAVRLWPNAYDHFRDYLNDFVQPQPDLAPIGTEVDGLVEENGLQVVYPEVDPVRTARVFVHNHSTQAFDGQLEVDFILKDAVGADGFEADDRVIGSAAQVVTIDGQSGAWIEATVSFDPDLLESWESLVDVGAVVRSSDAVPGNNVELHSWGSTSLQILHASHDLDVDLEVPEGTFTTNGHLPFDVTLSNDGLVETGFVDADFYVSTTSSVNASAIQVASGWNPSVPADSVHMDHDTVPLAGLSDGQRYLVGVFSLPDGTEVEAASNAFDLQWQPPGLQGQPPNLRVDYLGFLSGTYEAGDDLMVSLGITNTGAQASPVWDAEFYASRTPDLSGEVRLLGTGLFEAVAGGVSTGWTVPLSLSGLPAGSWYVAMEVNSANDAADSDNFIVSSVDFDVPVGGFAGAPPNLTPDSVWFVGGDYTTNDLLDVELELSNTGNQSSAVWFATFSASRYADMSNPVVLTTTSGASLPGSTTEVLEYTLPLFSLSTGEWYLEVDVSSFNDDNPTDNAVVSEMTANIPLQVTW